MTSPEPPPSPEPGSAPQGLPAYGTEPPPGSSYPPPPGGYPPPAPGGYSPAPQTNQMAMWSMILGIVGVVCCGFFVGVPAVAFSLLAKKQIAASGGREGGAGMATAGLVLGIVSIGTSAFAFYALTRALGGYS